MTLSEIVSTMYAENATILDVRDITTDPAELAAWGIEQRLFGTTFHSPWDFMEDEDRDTAFNAMVEEIRRVYELGPVPEGSGRDDRS